MKATTKKVFEILIFVLTMVSVVFVVVCLPYLPEIIPAHYDGYGNVDRMGSKYELLLLPLSNILVFAIILLVRHFSDRSDDIAKAKRKEWSDYICSILGYLILDTLTAYFTVKVFGLVQLNIVEVISIVSLALSLVLLIASIVVLWLKYVYFPNTAGGITAKISKQQCVLHIILLVVTVALITVNLLITNQIVAYVTIPVVAVSVAVSIVFYCFARRNCTQCA